MINIIRKDAENRMKQCIDAFKKCIIKIRTGRANPQFLDSIQIEYYGTLVPISKVTNIVSEDARTLSVTVFDRMLTKSIEKAIMTSDLGLNPYSTGTIIRVPIPPLTEDRRRDLLKLVRAEAENSKISIRKIRRDANDKIKILMKKKSICEDEDRSSQEEIQKITNNFIKNIDSIVAIKESELMNI